MKNAFARLILLSLLLACAPAVVAQSVNVRDYGASPDDSHDDTAAIQRAVHENPNRSIYFPAGIYYFSGTIDLHHHAWYHLHGDGSDVTTIAFRRGHPYGYAGIANVNAGDNALTVERMTLRADEHNCGAAIYAIFNGTPVWHRNATIRDVQITGNVPGGYRGGYWNTGIYLDRAQNAVIDKVEINGNNVSTDGGGAQTHEGIVWVSPDHYRTVGLRMTNVEIHWCDSAIRTAGWVEDVVLDSFEVVLAGQHGRPAIDLTTSDVNRTGNFHINNGHLNLLQEGLRLTNVNGATVSKVHFLHYSQWPWMLAGDHLEAVNSRYLTLSFNSFNGPTSLVNQPSSGIHLRDGTYWVHVEGNFFHHFRPNHPDGACIAVRQSASTVGIVFNLFETVDPNNSVTRPFLDERWWETYYQGNNM